MDSEGITPKKSLPTLQVFHHDLKALNKYSKSEHCHGPFGERLFQLGVGWTVKSFTISPQKWRKSFAVTFSCPWIFYPVFPWKSWWKSTLPERFNNLPMETNFTSEVKSEFNSINIMESEWCGRHCKDTKKNNACSQHVAAHIEVGQNDVKITTTT